jgi:hypothetical protein
VRATLDSVRKTTVERGGIGTVVAEAALRVRAHQPDPTGVVLDQEHLQRRGIAERCALRGDSAVVRQAGAIAGAETRR